MIKMNQINEGKKFICMSFAIFVVICFTTIMTIVAITAKGENSSENFNYAAENNNGLGNKGITINWSETDDEGKVHTWYYERGLLVNYTIKEPGLTKGLVSYYKFDGDVLDSHGIYDGTNYGATNTEGIIGDAKEFDGMSNYVSIPNIVGSSSEGTISTWINVNSISGETEGILCAGINYEPWIMLHIGESGALAFTVQAVGTISTNNGAITTNSWHHVVYTSDGISRSAIYIDGSLRETTGNGGGWLNDIAYTQLAIGVLDRPDNYGEFDGKIDELGIWNRALTADEISELYNSGNGLSYPFEE